MLARVLVRTGEREGARRVASARAGAEAASVPAGHGWFLEALQLAGPMLASYEHGDERFWEQALTGTLRHVCQAWCLAHRRPPSLADISAAIGEPARLRELVSGAGAAARDPNETARARALVGWYRNNWTEMPALNPCGCSRRSAGSSGGSWPPASTPYQRPSGRAHWTASPTTARPGDATRQQRPGDLQVRCSSGGTRPERPSPTWWPAPEGCAPARAGSGDRAYSGRRRPGVEMASRKGTPTAT